MMSSVPADQASDLRVALLHNYRDERQPSMRLYAKRLGDALLRRGVSLRRLSRPPIVPSEWRARSSAWVKVDGCIGRFTLQPHLVDRLECEVIHVVDHGQGYWLSDHERARTVMTCHDVILLAVAAGRIGVGRVSPLSLQLFRISSELMKRSGAVVTVSTQTKRDLTEFLQIDPARITVVSPGLNHRFSPNGERRLAARAKFNLGSGPLVLQVGRRFYKNIPAALRVIQGLCRQGLDVRLVHLGPPLIPAERAHAQRLGVADRIVDLGIVADEDMPGLYNAADVLLFPSLYEGFGWPPIEAMASGTPVVCSRAGALNELVDGAALTADPEDAEALAWHVGTVLTDSKVRDVLVARGLVNAARFDWDRTAGQMVGVYRDVLQRAA